MKTRIFLALVGSGLVLLCGAVYAFPRDTHPTPPSGEPTPAPTLNIAGIDGAALYERLCDKCHGLREANYGPALTSLSNASDEAIGTLILRGVPETAMGKPEESLSPEQLAALVKFVKTEALPKSPADAKALAIGLNAAPTQMELNLVTVEGGDLIARAMLKDDKGAPLAGKPVVFNRVSSLGGRLPFATMTSTAQGLAIAYYPIKAGDQVRMEAAFEGERGRQASTATGEASLTGGKQLDSLAEGLLSPNPQFGLLVILGLIIGGIWLTFAYVLSLLAGIRSRQP